MDAVSFSSSYDSNFFDFFQDFKFEVVCVNVHPFHFGLHVLSSKVQSVVSVVVEKLSTDVTRNLLGARLLYCVWLFSSFHMCTFHVVDQVDFSGQLHSTNMTGEFFP